MLIASRCAKSRTGGTLPPDQRYFKGKGGAAAVSNQVSGFSLDENEKIRLIKGGKAEGEERF